ncbi:hypothetical protein ACIBI8_39095 [Streptomyces sp. NPDC050529]|uniref:hypothetical protein n=1 Tax=unclassified Streptomyces TaxID=2593676 RepID=UPI002DD7DB63|nr:hypothetical protein [Streptomyces sp. NBC_01022]WRZ82725.1 hypothetical protein OG316_21900 [Streptomyces sp. NBC_01022]
MNTALKITAFTAGLATVFGASYGIGHATGGTSPKPSTATHAGHTSTTAPSDPAPTDGDGDGASGGAGHLPGGLQISERGYTLSLSDSYVTAGAPVDLRFRILGADGSPVTAYQPAHGKELHLIVAPRDLSTFQHLHPTRAADGTWRATAAVPAAGEYRVFADFTPAGASQGLTLGADLHAAGDLRPAPPAETGRAVTVDGYRVTLTGDLIPGRATRLSLAVARDGRPVTDLQPYLGAYGHLVALRAGDLAYLHVHPDGEPGDAGTAPGPDITFTTTAPSRGGYRLFLDFRHGGVVRTAAFTVTAADSPANAADPATPSASAPAEHDGDHQH